MYKIRSLALVAVAILFGGVFAVAAAQMRMPPSPIEPPLPVGVTLSGTYSMEVSANQLSAGDIEFVTGTTYGSTFYGQTVGDVSGFMFVSMNYTSLQAPPADMISEGTAGGVSQVTGGSWSKLIFIKGEYVGSVYGRVVGGELVWSANKRGTTTNINLQLTADDGTEAYVGNAGTGTFEGMLDLSSKFSTVSGKLTLTY